MNDIRFTDDQVRDMLRTVVAENPDFVYDAPDPESPYSCRYVYNGAPSCLVGHVMVRLGFPLGEFKEYEGQSPQQFYRDLGVSVRAADVLTGAQDWQDQGFTWSSSLAAAEGHWED